MELLVGALIVLVIWLWARVSRLTERIEHVDRRLLDALDAVRDRHATPRTAPAAAPEAAPVPAPVVVATPIEPAPIALTRPERFEEPERAPAPGRAVPLPEPAIPEAPPAPVAPAAPAALVASAAPAAPAALVAPAAPEEPVSWELTVGTSWLNKVGVLTLVIGVAFLVGYSFTQIGPAGRVAIGYLLSGTMLGAGVWLERRETFRNYAYGLVAGGWACIYFTTFAMHDVPAAKIIESDLVAVFLLSVVAAGMVAHSLRYRAQVVTGLAFIVAYATLALSPLSGFSLAASVPLAMSVLLVSQRLGWPGISVLGIAATYGVFVLRGEIFPGGAMDPQSPLPYAALAAYWLTFEIADLIGLRLRRAANAADSTMQVSMLALNAAGFLGAIVIVSPGTDPEWRSTVLFTTAAAYIASAVVRAWLLPERRSHAESERPFDVSHAATAMAALLFAIALGLRFGRTQEGLGWLLETQLLFVAGLTLSDRWLRRIGSVVAALVTIHAGMLVLLSREGGDPVTLGMSLDAIVAAMVAMVWYANREAMRIRGLGASWLEPFYTWAGTILLAACGWASLSPAHLGLAGWLFAFVLLEAGLRRDHEYTLQSYVIGAASAHAAMLAFLSPAGADGLLRGWGPAPTTLDDWTALPVGIAVLVAATIRLLSFRGTRPAPVATAAAGTAATLAVTLTVIFEWRVLPADAVAPAWALTALGLIAIGAWKQQAAPRWLGYLVSLGAAFRQIAPLIEDAPETTAQIAAGATVIAAMYIGSYLGGRASGNAIDAKDTNDADDGLVHRSAHESGGLAHRSATREGGNKDRETEWAMTAALSLAATACFVLWKYRVLPDHLVAPAWALTGLVLAALGFYRRREGQRWQGYALACVASAHAAVTLLDVSVAARVEGWSAGAVVAGIYATAWMARRSASRGMDKASASSALLVIGTGLLALLESRLFGDLTMGPAWTTTAIVMLGVGLRQNIADLRWHGYALLTLGAVRAGRPVLGEVDATSAATVWLVACVLAIYVMALTARGLTRAIDRSGDAREAEDTAISGLLISASVALAGVIVTQARSSMVTLLLALQGLGVMAAGLFFRERPLRFSGLALLLACLLKVFLYDLRALEPLPRIFSFVALGLVLLGISWAYTRYREQIKKLL